MLANEGDRIWSDWLLLTSEIWSNQPSSASSQLHFFKQHTKRIYGMNPISIRGIFTDVMKNENVDTDAIVDLQQQALQRLDTIPSVSIHSSESRCLAVMSCHVMSCHFFFDKQTWNTKRELLLTSHLINLPSQNLEWVSYARCWGTHSLLNLSLPLL